MNKQSRPYCKNIQIVQGMKAVRASNSRYGIILVFLESRMCPGFTVNGRKEHERICIGIGILFLGRANLCWTLRYELELRKYDSSSPNRSPAEKS